MIAIGNGDFDEQQSNCRESERPVKNREGRKAKGVELSITTINLNVNCKQFQTSFGKLIFFLPFSLSLYPLLNLSLAHTQAFFLFHSLQNLVAISYSASSPPIEGQTLDLTLVHSNMAILNLGSQVLYIS